MLLCTSLDQRCGKGGLPGTDLVWSSLLEHMWAELMGGTKEMPLLHKWSWEGGKLPEGAMDPIAILSC